MSDTDEAFPEDHQSFALILGIQRALHLQVALQTYSKEGICIFLLLACKILSFQSVRISLP